jgi:uncharacterized protein YndB with AHSA1/START domain
LSDTQLRLERLIAAPPAHVFALWIDPVQIIKWWGPDGYQVPSSAFDVRTGGRWHTTVLTPDGQRKTVSGVYRVIDHRDDWSLPGVGSATMGREAIRPR